MIPTIGVMIGAYIITRMLDIALREQTGIIVMIFAVLTIIVACFGMLALISSGAGTALM